MDWAFSVSFLRFGTQTLQSIIGKYLNFPGKTPKKQLIRGIIGCHLPFDSSMQQFSNALSECKKKEDSYQRHLRSNALNRLYFTVNATCCNITIKKIILIVEIHS